MALLAEKVSAATALEWGLIAGVVPDDDFDAEIERVSRLLADGPPLAYSATKRVLNAVTLEQLQATLQAEREGQGALLLSADFAEGMAAFQEKRPADFRGA